MRRFLEWKLAIVLIPIGCALFVLYSRSEDQRRENAREYLDQSIRIGQSRDEVIGILNNVGHFEITPYPPGSCLNVGGAAKDNRVFVLVTGDWHYPSLPIRLSMCFDERDTLSFYVGEVEF
jgi:hypothetical protein